jgi:Fe-S-cluster containining protein
MSDLRKVNLRSFKQKVVDTKRKFRRFLNSVQKHPPRGLKVLTATLETEVWKEVDCLSCANCCKKMSPTFTNADVKRISAHFGQTSAEFRTKWLVKERGHDGDWLNKSQPCQFLNLKNNKCSIYEIRPSDCVGFPHLPKKIRDYAHVHKQNIEYCPATNKLVEKMFAAINLNGRK